MRQEHNNLIRPDRQITYSGIPPKDWPPPPNDEDTACIDKLYESPPYRLIIKKGDTVDVDISMPGTPVIWRGVVTSIAHDHPEGRKLHVTFADKNMAGWFTLFSTLCVSEKQTPDP